MKTRTLRIALGSLVCLALLAGFSTSGAQAPASPVPPQDGGEAPVFQIAPLRPRALKPPSYSKGYIPPPMDLSHLTGQRMPSGGVSIQALPAAFDWRDMGKVTSVKNQSTCGSCYAFAALGNIESKLLIDGAGTFDFSENHAKECNWYETGGSGTSCGGGSYFVVANLLSKKGTALETCDPYVPSDVSCRSTCPYQKTLLDWRIINGGTVPNTGVLKQYIYDHGPVFTAMYAGHYDAWDTEFSSYDGSYTLYHPGTETPNHGVLIVGWDDSLTHAGGTGGWIVKNSWGTGWGENGYFEIGYGSASIGTDSSFMYDWQDYDTSGGLMYYDEGGMSGGGGYGDTTAWGLARFIPTSNTNVTRVEFWTSDVTTDVDVYVYDDFNGTTLGSKLGEAVNNSFGEAGYHSVALSSPVPVTSGDDVIAVVKFTNDSYTSPIPVDGKGPSETGRTYVSHDGTGGSWEESSYDVAIRLRTSAAQAPDVRITKRVVGSDFEPGDSIAFTLDIVNGGTDVASGVVVTDTVPDEVLNPTYDSTLTVTPVGGDPYVWNVKPLEVGESGVITIYGQIDPNLESDFSFENTATISDPEDATHGNNTSSVTVGVHKVYSPLVMRNWPPQQTTKLYPVADAAVFQSVPDTNYGSRSYMYAGYDHSGCSLYSGKVARSLVRFDLSSIPAGASIRDAKLHLRLTGWCYYVGHSQPRTVTIYRADAGWSESSVTWNNKPGCAESYASASVSVTSRGWHSFDITNLVRGWVNGSFSNYGLMVRAPETSGSEFALLEFATHDYYGTTYDPYLEVTYIGVAAFTEDVPALGEVSNPAAGRPTFRDMHGISLGATDCGASEMVEQAVCLHD
jgi:uncharacterized repeat protein (TIGR01451 family)